MALLETCRSEIFEFNGLNLLVDFLNENPSNYMVHCASKNDSAESEISACERVQQKAAIAISRFSKEPKYASVFIELGGSNYRTRNFIKIKNIFFKKILIFKHTIFYFF